MAFSGNFNKFRQLKFTVWDFVEFLGYFLSLCGLVFYTSGITMKYFFNPSIGISEHQRQSHEIPFPAITICSPVVLQKNSTSVNEYYRKYKINKIVPKLTVSEQNFLAAQSQMCSFANSDIFDEGTKNRTERSVVKILHEKAPTVDETFPKCFAQYRLANCSFTRSLTDLGMCYTFNMQSFNSIFNSDVSSDFDLYKEKNHDEIWTLENGYSIDDETKIPYKSSLGRVFTFMMSVNETDNQDLCFVIKNSFRVSLHLTNEIPTIFHKSEYVNFKTGLRLKISAVTTKTDAALRKYSPHQRKCYFEGERKLQLFKAYTKVHCNLECLTNFTLRQCGCVHFSYPRNQSTDVCDLDRVQCSKNAFSNWPSKDEMSNSTTLPCDCLPTCNMIEYKVKERQIQEINENASVVIKEIASSRNYSSVYVSLNIEFGDFLITENENYVEYTLENFIADWGGLLGLFLGFSFTAMIRFIRSCFESLKARNTKVKAFDIKNKSRSSKISWIDDVENRDDFMTLLCLIDEQNYLAAKAQICGYPHIFPHFNDATQERTEKNFVKLLEKGAPDVDQTFVKCGQQNNLQKCSLISSRSLTDLGMCFTFNMQSYQTIFNEDVITFDFNLYKGQNYPKSEEIWSLEDGFTSDDETKIPFRSSIGQVFHFVLGVNETDLNDLCFHLKKSFKFFFHLPNEIPTVFHDSDHVNFENRMNIQVTATSTKTDKNLKKYSPKKRRCYFEGERKLQFFKSYTKSHCNFECLTNFTLRQCGCVPFSYPRLETTKICDLIDFTCFKKAFTNWPKLDEMSNSSHLPCDCLPTCSNIQYRVKQKQVSEISENSSVVVRQLASEINYKKIYTALNVEFGDFLITENSNYVAYTLENFIADCGGLLGLFLGFSFTALIAFFRNLIERYKKRKKADQEEENLVPQFKTFETKKYEITVIEIEDFESSQIIVGKSR